MNETIEDKMKKMEEDFFSLCQAVLTAFSEKIKPAPKPPVNNDNTIHIIITVDERKKD